jgi:hypothetical protein
MPIPPGTKQESIDNGELNLPLMALMIIALAVAAAWYLFQTCVHHDIAWYLFLGERVLDGARLYETYIDNNPPFVIYFNLLPVWFAHVFGTSDLFMFYAFVFAFIFASLSLCYHIIQSLDVGLSDYYKCMLIVITAVLFMIVPLSIFGQREHLMMVLTFPYIFSLMGQAEEKPQPPLLQLLTGVMAGIGMAFKPFFFSLWILLEGYTFLFTGYIRFFRLQNIAIIVTTLLYGILLISSGYIKILPFLLASYGGFQMSFQAMIKSCPTILWLALVPVFIYAYRHTRLPCKIMHILFLTATAYFFNSFIQRKDWYYHNYPLIAVSVFIVSLLVLHRFDSGGNGASIAKKIKRMTVPVVVLAAFLYVFSYKVMRDRENPYLADIAPTVKTIRHLAHNKPIYIFTTNVTIPFRIVNYAEAQWPVRFHCLWPLWTLYKQHLSRNGQVLFRAPGNMNAAEHYVFDSVVADLIAQPPALILEDRSVQPGLSGDYFQFIRYFLQDPRFARFFVSYRDIGQVGRFRFYLNTRLE